VRVSGHLEDVLPLADTAAPEAARPVTSSGELKQDSEKVEAHHDTQRRAVMKEGPVVVIILEERTTGPGKGRRLGSGPFRASECVAHS
jgi:hypothetical protein